jgi:hypothetical protein
LYSKKENKKQEATIFYLDLFHSVSERKPKPSNTAISNISRLPPNFFDGKTNNQRERERATPPSFKYTLNQPASGCGTDFRNGVEQKKQETKKCSFTICPS